MRKKRKKTRLKPKPVIWLFLTMTLIYGIWFSSVTAIRHVRIEGALEGDQQRLQDLIIKLQGIPCIKVNAAEIEASALELQEMKSASFGRSPFGSGLLKVTYRVPVARLFGSPNMLLDASGVLYPSMAVPKNLPQVQLPKGGPPSIVTLAGNWQPERYAKLAIFARSLSPDGVIRIQMGESGVVSLNLDSERVIFGSLEDLDNKVETLKKRMADYPNELSENEALDLTRPDFPSLIPRRRAR